MNDFESTVPDMYLYQYSSPVAEWQNYYLQIYWSWVEIQKLWDLQKMVTKHLPTAKY